MCIVLGFLGQFDPSLAERFDTGSPEILKVEIPVFFADVIMQQSPASAGVWQKF